MNYDRYKPYKAARERHQEVLKVINEFGEYDVWIFAMYLNESGSPIDFSKKQGRFQTLVKARANKGENNPYNLRDVTFNPYGKKDNILSKRIAFDKFGYTQLEVYLDEDEAYQEYTKRREMISGCLEEYKENISKRVDDINQEMNKI